MATILYDTFNPGFSFNIGSVFGLRTDPITGAVDSLHKGLDFPAAKGTPIPAAADGVVYAAPNTQQIGTDGKGWGYYAVIEHTREDGSKFYSLYAHFDEASTLKVGDKITAGSTIGFVQLKGSASHYFWSNHATTPTH